MASMARFKVASLYTRILQDTLSPDIIDMILSYLGLDASSFHKLQQFPELAYSAPGLPAMDHSNHPAEAPPPDGKCPFMTLPTELRRAIFAESLPARDITIPVCCEDDEHKKKKSRDDHLPSGGNRAHSPTTITTTSSSSSFSPSSSSLSSTPSSAKGGPRPRTLDLLTLNRALCAELTELLYTEREFAVHVHEGFHRGGIEFLNSGRQPLQYYGYDDDDDDDDGNDCSGGGGDGGEGKGKGGGGRVKDPRFAGKFHSGALFGLDRVKKVQVIVLPPPPPPPPPRGRKGRERKEDGRMVSMNTYFMNLALVRLLERAKGKGRENRITRLRVEVADGREGKPEDEDDEEDNPNPNPNSPSSSSFNSSWWWDPHRSRPRETTFHGISNLQLVLLPFSRLRAHHVEILLPPSCAAQLASDPATGAFLRRLEGKITGSSSSSSSAAGVAAGVDDLLDESVLRNLEKARFAYEAFVLRVKFGGKGEEVVLLGEGDWEGEKVQEVAEEEDKEKGEGEVVEEAGRPELQRGKKNKKKKNGKKRSGRKNRKVKKWVGDSNDDEDEEDDDSEGDELGMQWALQQSLEQATEDAEKELQQAIRESLCYDREGSPGPTEEDDRDRMYYRGVSEDLEEMWLEDDEYDMGLSKGIDDFGFEDDEEEPGVSEDGGESDLNDGESDEGGNEMRETVSENDEYDSALSEDSKTTDSGDDEESWNGYHEGTEEGRAKAREFHSRRKKKSQARLPLVEPFGTTGQTGIDIWQVIGTASINSSTTFPEGGTFGQPVAAKWGPQMAVVEGQPGENMGPYSVQTGWEEQAMAVLKGMTPEYIAEAAGPALDGVASVTGDSPRFVLEGESDL
ncbi:hypothetical protein D0869_09760 [Hortaea werneckii]|uniref:Uncharacterized protein n=1 Tax=Hortaea werneckii TaxID=91943 RepID=A0A3M6WGP4_HORWE|nr:hypothetical protein KC324_g4535 [Hortaea werneckii]KAI7585104.1 hypothetical protein KC316_g6330 [Hortaea werneckii]RMX77601.1 hypothetical protein D0869_09760 [Hortaea werneckii]RMX99332.1 hypothetical protein D0868_09594 [Hortaea werneckii]